MSTPEDMTQCQERDDQGNPVQIFGPHSRGNYHKHEDNSVNKALPWVAVACIMSGLALGVGLMLGPLTDAKVERAKAEIRSEFADRIAKQDAYIEVAKYEASLAKTIAQRLDEKDKARSKP